MDGALQVAGNIIAKESCIVFQSYFWWMVRFKPHWPACRIAAGRVSILFLVDGALQGISQDIANWRNASFNPIFGGWCASRVRLLLQNGQQEGFNPIFGGWCASR